MVLGDTVWGARTIGHPFFVCKLLFLLHLLDKL